MEIIVKIKSVYGKRTIYPLCTMAKSFAAISGNKTLTDDVISVIKSMGFKIIVEPEQI